MFPKAKKTPKNPLQFYYIYHMLSSDHISSASPGAKILTAYPYG